MFLVINGSFLTSFASTVSLRVLCLQFNSLKGTLRHFSLIPAGGGGGILAHAVAHVASSIKVSEVKQSHNLSYRSCSLSFPLGRPPVENNQKLDPTFNSKSSHEFSDERGSAWRRHRVGHHESGELSVRWEIGGGGGGIGRRGAGKRSLGSHS